MTRAALLDIPEMAEYLSTTESHIRRLVLNRRIPFTKVGGKIRFDPRRIDTWLSAHAVAEGARS